MASTHALLFGLPTTMVLRIAAPIQISKVATWVCVGDPQYEEAEKAFGIYS